MSPFSDGAPLYLSYLLRIWIAGDGQHPQWRASLQNPLTGEQKGFSNLEELTAHLYKITGARNRPDQTDETDDHGG